MKERHTLFPAHFIDEDNYEKYDENRVVLDLSDIALNVFSLEDKWLTSILLKCVNSVSWTNLRRNGEKSDLDRNIALEITHTECSSICYAYESHQNDNDSRLAYHLLAAVAGEKPCREKGKTVNTPEIDFEDWLDISGWNY